MTVPRFRYRLRTLFVLIGIVAVGLTVRSWYQRIPRLAQDHHYWSLEAGYTAVQIEFPEAKNWSPGWTMWPHPLDRGALQRALPHWQRSIRHARLADYYREAAKRPWILLGPVPDDSPLPALPADDREFWRWWDTHLSSHVTYTGVNCRWGSYWDRAVNERHLAFLNLDTSRFNRFLSLVDETVPDADPTQAPQPAAGPVSTEESAPPAR